MSNERIDLAEIENMRLWTDRYKVGMFWDLIAELKRCYEEIDALKGQPKTKKTRYGKPWHYECPSCGASDDAVPQLNFKNRCCFLCGWNDFGQDPEVMMRSYNAKNASE